MILNIFLFFDDFEPGDSYKINSYKNVYGNGGYKSKGKDFHPSSPRCANQGIFDFKKQGGVFGTTGLFGSSVYVFIF